MIIIAMLKYNPFTLEVVMMMMMMMMMVMVMIMIS
jgi:hypothetical protein